MTVTETGAAVTCQVRSADLARAATNTMLYVGNDKTRGLDRAHIEIGGDSTTMSFEATDSYAMIRQHIQIEPVDKPLPGAVFDLSAGNLSHLGQVATMMSHELGHTCSTAQLSFAHGLLVASFGLDGPTVEVSMPVCADGYEWAKVGATKARRLWPKQTESCPSFHLAQEQLDRIMAVAAAEGKGVHPAPPIRFLTSTADGFGPIVVKISGTVQILQMPVRA